MKQEKIFLKDFQTPHFSVESIQLDFVLNEDRCVVFARSHYRKIRPTSKLSLNGEELILASIKLNGQFLESSKYELTAKELILTNVPDEFFLEIETHLEPHKNTSLEGLYKSSGFFCTQCEAEGFRKITYFLDRPDVMTSYSVTIEADKIKYPILLSNGDRIKIEDLGNGRHKAYWKDPHKKPCYLFALVAGDMGMIQDSFATKSGRKVNLEVYAAHGKQDRCWHAMESLKKSMKWDEATYGLEYDLNDYMIVAIDDFNAGAMENKGLNIFNSRLVLADSNSATDGDFQSIESVVAHEYFHNWTGNRVTLCNWFQLSLKEGLTVFRDQEFSADVTDRGTQRIEDVDSLRAGQFAEDAGPNAHPVRPDSCMAVDNFFTMTIYEKGAELIRMMQTIVGRRGFRRGMDEYFRRHDGQAVSTDDFAAAISEPNGKDFSQFKRWYFQSGTPKVKVVEKYDSQNKQYLLNLAQTCPLTPNQSHKEPFHIPLLFELLNSEGQELPIHCEKTSKNSDGKNLIELRDVNETFIFNNVQEKPILSILREFSAPIHLNWEASEEDLYFLMENDTDSFNRREMSQKLALKNLNQLVHKIQKKLPLVVDPRYLLAISKIIQDSSMEPGFKAKMLQLPSMAILAQEQEILDALAFHEALTALRKEIAKENRKQLVAIYNRYHNLEPQSRDTKVFAHRQLKNRALAYLAELGDPEVLKLVEDQYWNAKNMTDRMTALLILSDSQNAAREQALKDFYNEWKDDSVVINKWFSAQAASSRSQTLEDVRSLTKDPAFNITNPNNVYSLLRSFGANLLRFHDPATESYKFFADMILDVDSKNPQVAARLCAAFNFVKKLPPELKEKALAQIQRVLTVESLSKNSRELLQSALD
jgi:aminopeptidase N